MSDNPLELPDYGQCPECGAELENPWQCPVCNWVAPYRDLEEA